MSKETKHTIEKILYVKEWTNYLFSFKTSRSDTFSFLPGQFARLGITKINADNTKKIVWRPYSIVSATYNEYLEFYSIVVPDGEFTQELKNIQINDDIFIDITNYGLLTLDRFENGRHLWLLSTGTGLAPFISILYDLDVWDQYDKIILVHGARYTADLTYQDAINDFFHNEIYADTVKDKLIYVKMLTKDKDGADLYGRITDLINNHQLEQFVGIDFNNIDSRVMICGNPDMVGELRSILINRGLTISKRSQLGNIALENYW